MNILNPATHTLIQELEEDSRESIQLKLEKLKKGQKSWAKKPVKERLGIILQFGKLVKEKRDELAAIMTEETGKPIQQSKNEVDGAHNRLEHLAANAEKWLATEKVTKEGATLEEIHYEPLGVLANISAWNYPYNVGYNVFLYALVAGNSVMYKPSEHASLTGIQFQSLLYQAGVPKDVFEIVIGGAKQGSILLELDLDGYYFTGSYRTGKLIAERVASKLVPVQLELGGKDPLYVADDVPNVKTAAENAAEGAFYNNGQSCCAVERIYVQEGIYDQFVEHFVETVGTYKVGEPNDPENYITPLTREQQIEVLLGQVQDAQANGATLQLGGSRVNRNGNYFQPTVISDTTNNMLVMQEESFGPIIGIMKVKDDAEATALMKDTVYGLTAAVFSSSEERAMKILDEMNTGTVYWNCCDRVSPNLPWSGRKNSGLGSTLSYQGIRAFTQPKSYQMRP